MRVMDVSCSTLKKEKKHPSKMFWREVYFLVISFFGIFGLTKARLMILSLLDKLLERKMLHQQLLAGDYTQIHTHHSGARAPEIASLIMMSLC